MTATTTLPKRVQVQGDLFHGRIPDGAVYIGRAAPGLPRSVFHNPFKLGAPVNALYGEGPVRDIDHALDLFAAYVRRAGRPYREQAIRHLAGRDLACWCKPGSRCHGDLLLQLVAGGVL